MNLINKTKEVVRDWTMPVVVAGSIGIVAFPIILGGMRLRDRGLPEEALNFAQENAEVVSYELPNVEKDVVSINREGMRIIDITPHRTLGDSTYFARGIHYCVDESSYNPNLNSDNCGIADGNVRVRSGN
jgi:hypothetical protein